MTGKRARRRRRDASSRRSSRSSRLPPGWRGGCEPARVQPAADRRRRPGRVRPLKRRGLAGQPAPSAGIGVPVAGDPGPTSGVVAEAPTQVRLPERYDVAVDAVSTTADGLLDVPDDIRTAGLVARRLAARRPLRVDADRGPHRLDAPRASARTSSCCGWSGARGSSSVPEAPGPALRRRPRCGWSPRVPGGRDRPLRAVRPATTDMVTCAGPYVAARGGYQNLAVVTARPVTQPRQNER